MREGLSQGHEQKSQNLETKRQKGCWVGGKMQGVKAEKNTKKGPSYRKALNAKEFRN